MKNFLPYILVIAGTFILSAIVVFGTLMLRPDLLTGSATVQPTVDSLAVNAAPKYLREYAGPTLDELQAANKSGMDSLRVYRDSVSTLLAALASERSRETGSPVTMHQDSIASPIAVVDSTREKTQKSRAKLLEAMPPEDAAKILANLTDDETKQLLKYVKARQAAKIIASIQPDRASKLFR